ncbi:hypothetical protein QYE76_057276 [Lolium multiflorum]|uniref:Uncharacterized protein n=1 Tax=Lolium multiflorum TaxID=4521 RepID=A0AAD8T335_LOLMU|nr:hypothetical protein QYE76_057276 [Lolium multiflorum]
MGKNRVPASSGATASVAGSRTPTAARKSGAAGKDPQCDWSASSITKRDEKKSEELGADLSQREGCHLTTFRFSPQSSHWLHSYVFGIYAPWAFPPSPRISLVSPFSYGIQLWQLTPNSILHLAIFITVCVAFLGIDPHWGLWRKIFFVKHHRGGGVPHVVEGVGFVVRKEVNYFNFPMREPVQGWRSKWFYLRDYPASGHHSNLLAFEDVLEAVPKKSWQNTLTAEEKVIVDKLYEKVLDLKNVGGQTMCGTEVAALFLKHRVHPVMLRRHQMWLNTGPKDVTQINTADLTDKELPEEVRRLTYFSQEDSISLTSIPDPYEFRRLPTEASTVIRCFPPAPESGAAPEDDDLSEDVEENAELRILARGIITSISMNEVRKKLFTISLSGKAAHWYKLLKNGDSIDWEDIVPLFYSKFYPPSEIHKDRNRIYNFWPHDGESIAQAWGRLKFLMLKCPIHELPGNVIIDNFYARLSFQDKTLLDTSCSGSFTRNKEEFKRDLLDRIQENTEGWENDKDRESGIIYDYKCIEAFMDTDKFRNMSATYGLDSQVVANLYKAFASHYELPKKNFDKYHEPYKDKVDSSVNKCVVIETADNVIPEAYIEKTPFPAKMKEYSVISSAVNKSEKKPKEPEEQIKIEPAVAIVKDLVTENVEDGHIIFCEDASNIVSHPNKPKQVSVPMLSVRIGDHCYYGLCDIGASVSAIPYELYTEIMHEIGSCELEDIDVVIHLANRETISPIGIVRDVEVLCGKIKYPADFLVLGSAASDHCPIIFGRPFLNTCGAIIDCKKEKILTRFAGEPYEFNFSKFTKTPYKADLPSNDFKMEQCASIVLVPNNPLQQHLENSESEAFRKERDELEEIFLRQPILKHDLPVEDLGTTPPPKEDPVFDLKPLPDNLKYAHIDDKKIYPVIISSKLSEIEEERLLEILKKHRGAIGYTLDDLKGISPSICQHAINMEDDAKPVVEHQRRLIPKMKEVVRNEVLKLLEAGIIYPIADSRWVSPVHCVPKKGGMTVVPNDNDELIPQRIVVGYRMCIDFLKVNKRCEETNLVLNWEKCHFMVNEGIVLGHKISERGIEVDRAKVEAIEKMPYPRDVKVFMEKLEQEVFNYKKMAEREVDIFHKIVSELIDGHKKETAKLWDDIFSLHDTTNKLQAQLYDVHNQNCEYENRFKRISHAASFRFPETKMSFVDGGPLPWKSDDGKDSPSSPKE